MIPLLLVLAADPAALVRNPRFTDAAADPNQPAHYALTGDARWGLCGTARESTDRGVVFDSGLSVVRDEGRAGSVTQRVTGFAGGVGKWFRFTVRGLAEPGFAVPADGLFLRVGFSGKAGTDPLDGVTQQLYPLVERDRTDLKANGVRGRNGGAVWKTYELAFRLPFNEIDTLDLTVAFRGGCSTAATRTEFYVTEFALTAVPPPADAPKAARPAGPVPDISTLLTLGGRWYYDPETPGMPRPETLTVTAANAGRLYYRDDRLSNPFAENMTAWLRAGNLDAAGTKLTTDKFVPDNVVLEFVGGKELRVRTHNVPNHPTAVFPGFNPNALQEKVRTYYLPLEPVRNPAAVAMDQTNSNRGLPMGPIGFAVNGVAFFNPFDAGREEAVDMMDRCCGHPAPDNMYHYHKYPVCVKTPFADAGDRASPLIGFALDGFPVYGPYVAKGKMADGLDAFNMREDAARGWHYVVTPGKFPYLIGGFAGPVDPRNGRRGPRR